MFKGNLSIGTSDHRPVIKYCIFSLRTICQNFDVKYIKPHKIKLLDVLPSDFHIYIYGPWVPSSTNLRKDTDQNYLFLIT